MSTKVPAREQSAKPPNANANANANAVDIARRLTLSERLRRRRFELLPLQGPGAVFTEMQGRGPGPSTAPASLVELISSIATVGVLQPVLVEEMPGAAMRLVAGERRVRAARWGAVHQADNPHFAAIPAVVCPGPLSEQERRVWQLVENLAREDLQPGELAAALLYERSAVLMAKLLGDHVAIPADVAGLEDPVARFRALDRVRVGAGRHHIGAPWAEVLRRLGIQMREDKARQLVRAFAALPAELSCEMDAAKVALATRLDYLRLERGSAEAAAELWAAVGDRQAPQLLSAAIRERLVHPELGAEEALDRAGELRESADAARAAAQRPAAEPSEEVDPQLVGEVLDGLRRLVGFLRNGASVRRFDAGSLRMFSTELLDVLGTESAEAAA